MIATKVFVEDGTKGLINHSSIVFHDSSHMRLHQEPRLSLLVTAILQVDAYIEKNHEGDKGKGEKDRQSAVLAPDFLGNRVKRRHGYVKPVLNNNMSLPVQFNSLAVSPNRYV